MKRILHNRAELHRVLKPIWPKTGAVINQLTKTKTWSPTQTSFDILPILEWLLDGTNTSQEKKDKLAKLIEEYRAIPLEAELGKELDCDADLALLDINELKRLKEVEAIQKLRLQNRQVACELVTLKWHDEICSEISGKITSLLKRLPKDLAPELAGQTAIAIQPIVEREIAAILKALAEPVERRPEGHDEEEADA